jgi:hypothetical protein
MAVMYSNERYVIIYTSQLKNEENNEKLVENMYLTQ